MARVLIDGHKINFDPGELDVFAALFNARGDYRTMDHLVSARYSGSMEPESAERIIRLYLHNCREKLKPTDFRIQNHMGRGWWLSRLPPVINIP